MKIIQKNRKEKLKFVRLEKDLEIVTGNHNQKETSGGGGDAKGEGYDAEYPSSNDECSIEKEYKYEFHS